MAIPNYTTKIPADKTVSEIQAILVKKGAQKFVFDYDNGRIPSAVSFALMMGEQMTYFSLPVNYAGVLNAMTKDRDIPRSHCTKEQAIRTAWRITKIWILAQIALIEAGAVELPEVFFPYAVTKNGNTLYKELKANPTLLLTS
jgi:hypothetical protein